MKPAEFKRKINSIISYSSRTYIGVKLLLSAAVFGLIVAFAPQWAFVVPIAIILIFKYNIEFDRDRSKAFRMLKQAVKEFSQKNYDKVIGLLIKANSILNNPQLLALIKQISGLSDAQELVDLELIKGELENAKDQKLKQILNETVKVLNYLVQHKQELAKLEKKKFELEKELISAPSAYYAEIKNLIRRYENIIELEKSKIDFYRQLYQELKDLKKAYYYRNKLMNEYQYLQQLEDQYYSSSVKESYEADQKASFIDFQNTYLEALAQYAEQINRTSSQDMFENLKNDFENKKKQIAD